MLGRGWRVWWCVEDVGSTIPEIVMSGYVQYRYVASALPDWCCKNGGEEAAQRVLWMSLGDRES